MLNDFVIISIVSLGISYLMHDTDGPFDIFVKLKLLAGLYVVIDAGELLEIDEPDTFFAKLLRCFWCTTTWVSLFVTLAYILVLGYDMKMVLFAWMFSVGLSG